jgi:alpha-1,2-mannosyltransferase
MFFETADCKTARLLTNARHARRSRQQLLIVGLVVLAMAPMVDFAVWLAHHPSAAGYVKAWVLGKEGTDSWYPMTAAMDFFHRHPHGRIFQQVFFIDGIKFQYPLSSLLIHQALWLHGIVPSDASLNRVNWWLILANVGATGAFGFLMAKRSREYAQYRFVIAVVVAIGTLIFFPVVDAFYLGQVQVWINTLFALTAIAWLANRKGLAGALIGLMCLLKPQFGLFLLWGIMRREWRFIGYWTAIVAPGLGLSVLVFGLQNHLDYIPVLRALSRSGEAFIDNQSFNGLLNRLLATGDPANLIIVADVDPSACSLQSLRINSRLPPFNPTVYGGTLLSSAAMIGLALLLPRRRSGASTLLDFLGAALTFTMASPVAWIHHYGILPSIYVAVLFVLLAEKSSPRRSLALAMLAVSYLITGHWLAGSSTLLGALALLGVLYAQLFARRVSGRRASFSLRRWMRIFRQDSDTGTSAGGKSVKVSGLKS